MYSGNWRGMIYDIIIGVIAFLTWLDHRYMPCVASEVELRQWNFPASERFHEQSAGQLGFQTLVATTLCQSLQSRFSKIRNQGEFQVLPLVDCNTQAHREHLFQVESKLPHVQAEWAVLVGFRHHELWSPCSPIHIVWEWKARNQSLRWIYIIREVNCGLEVDEIDTRTRPVSA